MSYKVNVAEADLEGVTSISNADNGLKADNWWQLHQHHWHYT